MHDSAQGFIQDFLLGGGGGGKHLGELLKLFDVYLLKRFITEIMTSEIQKVTANKLVVNKFQLSAELLTLYIPRIEQKNCHM